jgi:hypothetical protein
MAGPVDRRERDNDRDDAIAHRLVATKEDLPVVIPPPQTSKEEDPQLKS